MMVYSGASGQIPFVKLSGNGWPTDGYDGHGTRFVDIATETLGAPEPSPEPDVMRVCRE